MMRKFVAPLLVLAIVLAATSLCKRAAACDCHPSEVLVRTSGTYTVTPKVAVVRTTFANPRYVKTVIEKREFVQQTMRKIHEFSPGSTVKARINFLGAEPGMVFVRSGAVTMKCELLEWSPTQVTFRLPSLEITEEVNVCIHIHKANGDVARAIGGILSVEDDIEIESIAAVSVLQ